MVIFEREVSFILNFMASAAARVLIFNLDFSLVQKLFAIEKTLSTAVIVPGQHNGNWTRINKFSHGIC